MSNPVETVKKSAPFKLKSEKETRKVLQITEELIEKKILSIQFLKDEYIKNSYSLEKLMVTETDQRFLAACSEKKIEILCQIISDFKQKGDFQIPPSESGEAKLKETRVKTMDQLKAFHDERLISDAAEMDTIFSQVKEKRIPNVNNKLRNSKVLIEMFRSLQVKERAILKNLEEEQHNISLEFSKKISDIQVNSRKNINANKSASILVNEIIEKKIKRH
jgi:hypothetical protein